MPYKNIEDRRACVLRAYYRLRQRLYDLKGGKCAACGRTLKFEGKWEVDHVEEDGRNSRRRRNRYKEYRRLLSKPEKYQLLCTQPCHRGKTMRYVRSFGKGGIRSRKSSQ